MAYLYNRAIWRMTVWRWIEFVGVWTLILLLPAFHYLASLFGGEVWRWALPSYFVMAGITIIADLRRRGWCKVASTHEH